MNKKANFQIEFNHGKTKSVRNQKRNAIFRRKNEMCNKKASKQ